MLNKVDLVELHWEHGENPDKEEVDELNDWLSKKEGLIKLRFESCPDYLALYVEREEW